MDGEWFDTLKNKASISNSGDISCNTFKVTNVYTKSYIDASLKTNYYTKSYIDTSLNTNYYTKSYIDTSLKTNYYTKSQSDANYYNKMYVDASLNRLFTEIIEIKSSGGLTGNFTGDIRVAGKINVGQNNPGGTGVLMDSANIQYVGFGSPDSGQTVLRIKVGGDDLTSGSQDNINLNPTKHQNLNGVSSIVFPSSTQTDGGDYGYIKYIDDINNNVSATPYGGENARLVIGLENDKTGDSIVLVTPETRGFVGINNMNPTCALDVTGDGKLAELLPAEILV